MKVSISKPGIQVSDELVVKLANVLDGKISKRRATRDEVKDYIWQAGADWAQAIEDDWSAKFREVEVETEPDLDEEDLI